MISDESRKGDKAYFGVVFEYNLMTSWHLVLFFRFIRFESEFILLLFLGCLLPLDIRRRRHRSDFIIIIIILLIPSRRIFRLDDRLLLGRWRLDVSFETVMRLTSSTRLLFSSLAVMLTGAALVFLPKLIGSPKPSMTADGYRVSIDKDESEKT
jgi:hypothetical protein